MNSLTPILTNIWSFLNGFLVVILLFAALFAFAEYKGRAALTALIASFYVGYAVYAFFPYSSLLPTAPALTSLFATLAVYAVFVLISYFALRRTMGGDYGTSNMLMLVILCLLTTGMLMALAYHVFPVRSVIAFITPLNQLFLPKNYFFWWFIAPIAGLLIWKR